METNPFSSIPPPGQGTLDCTCGKKLLVPPAMVGKKVQCPGCQRVLDVPAGDATQVLAPSVSHNDASEATIGGVMSRGERELTDFLAPPQQPDEIGRLGGYRVLKMLGMGGMGVVFLAEDVGLRRKVAIKAMLPRLADNPSARERFFREARAAAALKHDHIVVIHQVGEDRGAPFLAMEFLEGESLDELLSRECRFPLEELLRIGREVAAGLEHAHERGMIHRDIKPANIWLEGKRGRAKILDFGLARGLADDIHLTQSGVIVGTPAYMPPEQARGESVDARSDLYSLGVMLYRMATGEMPFKGKDTMSLLTALALETPPEPRTLNPDLPPVLNALITQLLKKNPNERPSSATEVAQRLLDLERDNSVTQVADQRAGRVNDGPRRAGGVNKEKQQPRLAPWSRRTFVVIAAGALLLLLGIVLFRQTSHGRVRLESDDPDVYVIFGKGGPSIQGTDKEPISLRAGEYDLVVQRGDFTFEAAKLLIKEGETVTLKVERLPNRMQLVADGKLLGSRPLPPPPPAIAPFDAKGAVAHQEAWAGYLGVPVEYANKTGMKFRLIPPGEFVMGLSEEELEIYKQFGDHKDRGPRAAPAHKVRLTLPIYMGVQEITRGEFTELMKREPGNVPRDPALESLAGPLKSKCPWPDCIEFCNRLSEREGLTPAYAITGPNVEWIEGATGYRLPTEAEWEFSCRAGTTTLWFFGMTAPEAVTNKLPAEKRLRDSRKMPNPFGLVGMYGGSIEWCWDWYSPKYYADCARSGTVINPRGPVWGTARVQRGGSDFGSAGGELPTSNSAVRHSWSPGEVFTLSGFGRVVLPVTNPPIP